MKVVVQKQVRDGMARVDINGNSKKAVQSAGLTVSHIPSVIRAILASNRRAIDPFDLCSGRNRPATGTIWAATQRQHSWPPKSRHLRRDAPIVGNAYQLRRRSTSRPAGLRKEHRRSPVAAEGKSRWVSMGKFGNVCRAREIDTTAPCACIGAMEVRSVLYRLGAYLAR